MVFSIIELVFRLYALFTRDILAHNIAIKRNWDKKIFLSDGLQWLAKVSS